MITQNIFLQGGKGNACIAGPESMLVQQYEPGILTAELDMDRLRYLREHILTWAFLRPELPPEVGPSLRCRPAQHRLRRPEVYRRLLESRPDDFDYWYFLNKGEAAAPHGFGQEVT